MQLVIALGIALGFAWLIGSTGSGSVERAISAMAELIGGWRGDAWPRGVQEEDRDQPWGWRRQPRASPSRPTLHDVAVAAPTTRLRPRTTAR